MTFHCNVNMFCKTLIITLIEQSEDNRVSSTCIICVCMWHGYSIVMAWCYIHIVGLQLFSSSSKLI